MLAYLYWRLRLEIRWIELLDFIHKSDFDSVCSGDDPLAQKLLSFYTNHRKAIIEEGTDLYKMKEVYDLNHLHSLRRVKRGKGADTE